MMWNSHKLNPCPILLNIYVAFLFNRNQSTTITNDTLIAFLDPSSEHATTIQLVISVVRQQTASQIIYGSILRYLPLLLYLLIFERMKCSLRCNNKWIQSNIKCIVNDFVSNIYNVFPHKVVILKYVEYKLSTIPHSNFQLTIFDDFIDFLRAVWSFSYIFLKLIWNYKNFIWINRKIIW